MAAIAISTCATATAASTSSGGVDPRITAMKENPRGPFSRIRWYCKDGTILPPEPDACLDHGGGSQHGEWSPDTLALRAAGYRIANIYADLDIEALLAVPRADRALAQMIIERFLARIDDGWILRRAQFYRGALQEEGERAGARRLLTQMAADARWTGSRYLTLRTLAALLPHGAETASARSVRQDASMLAQRDAGFVSLKNKIHISPAASDADAVRAYAGRLTEPDLATDLGALADAIAELHAADTGAALAELARRIGSRQPQLVAILERERAGLGKELQPARRLRASATVLHALRVALTGLREPELRLLTIDASLLVEADHFVAATELAEELEGLTRRQQLELLQISVDALYGVGLVSARQREVLLNTLGRVTATKTPALTRYSADVDELGLAPGWADRQLNFVFADGLARLAEIEPLAHLFIQDQLRGSPMFFYADVVDRLLRDVQREVGVQHRLFASEIGSGLRALNPGLARGILRDGRDLEVADFKADGIYLLPETVADLPPVAGILTAGSGNPLSHVQLLARNLGIPNVSIAANLLDDVAEHVGVAVVLAVSGGGTVHLLADDGSFAGYFEPSDARPQHLIEAELDKLDLSVREIADLSALRADDSGRTVGPKAAKLGELKAHYPQAVANGLALPFGIFRSLLERPAPDGSTTMFDYIVAGYRAIELHPPASPARLQQTESLRESIERWVGEARLSDELQDELRHKLVQRFGADGEFGVFVRSDTNVEDLPGFTGAGLNLTVPNVVGVDNIINAVPRVWASPFTARAFSWRQALMREPEHVYPAVLLLESVNVDKSGVLVTQDIDSGDRAWISVAVNEGVGGAVDGQSAESLRVHLESGQVRLLAQASASVRRQVADSGGVVKLPASGAERVLSDGEIQRLITFARTLPGQFPAIIDADGRPAPADVEFGFQDGELRLFQIRPFLDNPAARGNQYLLAMDPLAADLAGVVIDLDTVGR